MINDSKKALNEWVCSQWSEAHPGDVERLHKYISALDSTESIGVSISEVDIRQQITDAVNQWYPQTEKDQYTTEKIDRCVTKISDILYYLKYRGDHHDNNDDQI